MAIAALLLIMPSSDAQAKKQSAQPKKLAAVTKTAPTEAIKKPHRLILQVNSNEPAMMNLALNNASNVAQYYQDLGEKVNIDIVTFGPGLHMLRDDTSPVKARIKALSESQPSISFEACGNTRENMRRPRRRSGGSRRAGAANSPAATGLVGNTNPGRCPAGDRKPA